MNYWTTIQDELIEDYLAEENIAKKNIIYRQLRPALQKMIRGVLMRYYPSLLITANAKELIIDAETHIVTQVLKNFDTNKSKTYYAYLGTSIKHFLHSIFILSTKRKFENIETVDEQVDQCFDSENHNEYYDYIKTKALVKIDEMLKSDAMKKDSISKEIFREIKLFIEVNKDYNREILALHLSRKFAQYSWKKIIFRLQKYNMLIVPTGLWRIHKILNENKEYYKHETIDNSKTVQNYEWELLFNRHFFSAKEVDVKKKFRIQKKKFGCGKKKKIRTT